MARLFSIKPALAMKGRKFKGLRGFAGKPAHPPLTDIPVAAYVFAMVFDVASAVAGDDSSVGRDFFVSATHVLVAGFVVSVSTALTGFWDWWRSVAYGAIYGGALVYEYGFNVETSGDHPAWHESEEDVGPARPSG